MLAGCGGPSAPAITPPPTYLIGGTVNGLVGSGLELANDGKTSGATIAANGIYPDFGQGAFTSGEAYHFTVAVQPSNPAQTCTVSNGVGTVGNANVEDLVVSCTTDNS
jgi:hypothetical protein